MLILMIIGVCVSALCHWFIPGFALALMLSALGSAAVLQVVDMSKTGHLDPMFMTAFLVSVVIYTAVSVVVGMVVRGLKSKMQNQ